MLLHALYERLCTAPLNRLSCYGVLEVIVTLLLLLFFKPSVSIPEGGLKIDENKLKGYDAQSVHSGTGRLSCSRTALKRCTSTETR